MAMRVPEDRSSDEKLLRTMLRAYEVAALEACIAFYANVDEPDDDGRLEDRKTSIEIAVHALRDEIGAHLGAGDEPGELDLREDSPILEDYKLRFTGARAPDAPPLDAVYEVDIGDDEVCPACAGRTV